MKLASALIAGAVSALKIRDGDCEWEWEGCAGKAGKWRRQACDNESPPSDCGWYYWDNDTSSANWVTCDTRLHSKIDEYGWCHTLECGGRWEYDFCYEAQWMAGCPDEDEGWWHYTKDDDRFFWVSRE